MDEKNRQMNVQAEMPASVQVLGDDELAACSGGIDVVVPETPGAGQG